MRFTQFVEVLVCGTEIDVCFDLVWLHPDRFHVPYDGLSEPTGFARLEEKC